MKKQLKPSLTTLPKSLNTIPLVVFLVFISIIILFLLNVSQRTHTSEPHNASPIGPNELYCEQDSDCTLVGISCSSCDCGNPVNIKYKEYYDQQLQEECEGYDGPVCDMNCPYNVRCIRNTCTNELTRN